MVSNQVACAKLLVEYGCNANITNAAGERAYDMAVKFGRQEVGMAVESRTSEEGDKVVKGDGSIGTASEEENGNIQDDLQDIMKDGLKVEETPTTDSQTNSKEGITESEMHENEGQVVNKLVSGGEESPDKPSVNEKLAKIGQTEVDQKAKSAESK